MHEVLRVWEWLINAAAAIFSLANLRVVDEQLAFLFSI
jgi:hypothetical protein